MASAETGSTNLGGRLARILVADDHEVMRMGVRNLLESVPQWKVYAEASTGREAVEIALQSPPDLIIMDITMPEMNADWRLPPKSPRASRKFLSLCFLCTFPRTLWGASRPEPSGGRSQRAKPP